MPKATRRIPITNTLEARHPPGRFVIAHLGRPARLRGRLYAAREGRFAMQCATHPSVETELRCGRCEKPICPRCLFHSPVGARCRQCANIRRLPTYNISAAFLLRGAGAALAVGLAVGGLWALLLPFSGGLFFGAIVGVGVGYAVGEAVSVAANRKAGPPLQAIAAAGVVLAYLVRSAFLAAGYKGVEFSELVTEDIFGYLVVVLGVVVAIGRLR